MASPVSFDNVEETVQRVVGLEMNLDDFEHERVLVNESLAGTD